MLLSTMTGGISLKLGDKEAIRMIADAGFDSYDFSMHAHGDDSPLYNDGYREYAENLKQFADECDIPCTQAHAFFPSGRHGDDEFNKMAFNKIVRGMEVASILGARCIVVHPIKQFPEDIEIDVMQYNIDFYNRLLPYCKKFNIKVALENMFFRDKKRGHITNSVCGFGNEFAEIDYDEVFTYEADSFLKKFPEALFPDALKLMLSVGRYLIARIEEAKELNKNE